VITPVRPPVTPLTDDLRRLHVTVSRRFLAKLDAARDGGRCRWPVEGGGICCSTLRSEWMDRFTAMVPRASEPVMAWGCGAAA
jgi:hypothetical protein